MKKWAAAAVINHRCQRGDIKYVSTLFAIKRDTSVSRSLGVSGADVGLWKMHSGADVKADVATVQIYTL